jgi:hypothetical protein
MFRCVVLGYCTGPTDMQCCVTGDVPTTSTLGYDICDSMSSTTAACFKSAGYSFAVPRGYRSTGAVDTAVCTSIKNAATAGAAVRDTYMFPCPTCSKSAATQMSELVTHLKSNCASTWSGRVWLDIEGSQASNMLSPQPLLICSHLYFSLFWCTVLARQQLF